MLPRVSLTSLSVVLSVEHLINSAVAVMAAGIALAVGARKKCIPLSVQLVVKTPRCRSSLEAIDQCTVATAIPQIGANPAF